jgi:hypothetical protein
MTTKPEQKSESALAADAYAEKFADQGQVRTRLASILARSVTCELERFMTELVREAYLYGYMDGIGMTNTGGCKWCGRQVLAQPDKYGEFHVRKNCPTCGQRPPHQRELPPLISQPE